VRTLCHLNLARGFRGGERQTELLVRGLSARGWLQAVAVRRGEPLAQRLADVPGVDLRPVAGNVIAAALALGGVPLVHAHEGRSGQAAWLRKLIAGTPYVITRRVPARPGGKVITRRVYGGASRIVSISSAVQSVMAEYVPAVPGVRIPSAVAHLASDSPTVAMLRQRWAGRIVAGHVGALEERHKGQQLIIDAARALAGSRPELLFVLVGSGPDEARFRSAAADLPNVCFEGFRDNVGDYLAAFDLFLFPSRSEGLGSSLLDAMDFGLPVVATRVGGIPEVVIDGRTGQVVAPGDAAAFTAAVATLAADPERRTAMAAAARERAREFEPEAMVDAYERLYDELLGGPG
jgi:glycosyltransferase involved in cell wall biosynthesis